MRIPVIALVLALASPAAADDGVAGTYDVKVEATASTCDAKPETLTNGKLVLTLKKTALTVKLDKVFPMTGELKDGAITAKTAKLIGTAMAGLSARYAITGHVADNAVDLVLTAQYIRQDTNKPHCAAAWNVTGKRVP